MSEIAPYLDVCPACGVSRRQLVAMCKDHLMFASDSLDAAWAEAEAALPDGWRIKEVRVHDLDDEWGAEAENMTGVGRYRWVEHGPTPAAALRALTARLREARG